MGSSGQVEFQCSNWEGRPALGLPLGTDGLPPGTDGLPPGMVGLFSLLTYCSKSGECCDFEAARKDDLYGHIHSVHEGVCPGMDGLPR